MEKNKQKEEIIHNQIEKIKSDREKMKEKNIQKRCGDKNKMYKTYQMTYEKNINKTQVLKDELSKLEEMEEQYIQKIKKTQELIIKNNDVDNMRYNNYNKMKYKSIDNNHKVFNKKKFKSRSAGTSAGKLSKNNNNNNNIKKK